ncbi:hypothetical protein JCM11251_005312 [Rhodosporidiobolus azoricus]
MLSTLLPLLLATALATASPTSSSSSLSSSLLLLPADIAATSHPACGQYATTVGARTRTAIFYLRDFCAAIDRKHRATGLLNGEGAGVAVDFEWENVDWDSEEGFSTQDVRGEGALSTLLWLHPVTLDVDASSSTPVAGSDQITFSSASLPEAIPELEPTLVARLPGDGTEGYLVALSPVPSLAVKQLEYLTTHPSYALYSLISIPLPSPAPSTSTLNAPTFPDVPAKSVQRVKDHLDALRFSPAISKVLAGLDDKLSMDRLEDDVKVLTGEDQRVLKEEERWVTRHSMSTGAPKAARWLIEQLSSYSFHCTPHSYLPGFSPLLECVYQNSALGGEKLLDDTGYAREKRWAEEALREGGMRFEGNETVVLGAHYDSRGSFGYPTAPGADDDASGTALVLAVAREIAWSSVRFGRKIVFALFSGEEQGLLSSSYYARHLANQSEDVVMMLQVDMVGYRKRGEPMQLARPDVIGLNEAGWLVGNISEIYTPSLVTGYTPACCSDHQSFVESAYPASWIFERNGAIADPCYHNSCDVSEREGYSFEQIGEASKVVLGWVLELGGWAYL